MALVEINWNPSRRELRQFGAIFLPAFLVVIGGLVWSRGGSRTASEVLWGLAAVVSLVGYLAPGVMRPVFVGWMVAAYPIGWTVSHLILAVTFYLVLTPIGLLLRLFGHDPLRRAFDRSAETYWVPHNPGGDPSRYFRQF